jgi:hypothetical protein
VPKSRKKDYRIYSELTANGARSWVPKKPNTDVYNISSSLPILPIKARVSQLELKQFLDKLVVELLILLI